MPTPAETTVTFTELDVLETQVNAVVAAIGDAVEAIGSTTSATIVYTADPDTTVSDACAALVLASIKTNDFRAPVLAALNGLIAELNGLCDAYGAAPFHAAT